MRQAEARDLRSFLVEPVEEISLDRRSVEEDEGSVEDFTLQQTRPLPMVSGPLVTQRLRPYRLQRYQSRTKPLSRSLSGSLRVRPATARKRALRTRVTEQLVPIAQTNVPVAPSLRKRRDIYVWLVLIIVFLLVVLGGIGLDSLIASYRW